jgi:hypothetical protein
MAIGVSARVKQNQECKQAIEAGRKLTGPFIYAGVATSLVVVSLIASVSVVHLELAGVMDYKSHPIHIHPKHIDKLSKI